MGALVKKSNRIVATLVVSVWFSILFITQSVAQTPELDSLFEKLQEPDLAEWETVEAEIWRLWSKSGSPTIDLLLKRGRDAMEAGDTATAIEHFTAVTDHAPDFAEGWNMRATAYYTAGLYGASVTDIRRTLTLNPRHFGALSGFAIILQETGSSDRALEVFRAAQALHPHSPSINQAIDFLEREEEGRDL